MVFIRDYSTKTVVNVSPDLTLPRSRNYLINSEVEQVEEESALHFAFELQDNLSQP